MKFPKSSVLLCCFSLIFVSCKKEVDEKKSLKTIEFVVKQKKVSKENFKKTVLPVINDLYEKDSVKYRILNHIAKKAAIEKNPKIFSIQLNDMKSEMEFIK
jgi:ribosomal protein L20